MPTAMENTSADSFLDGSVSPNLQTSCPANRPPLDPQPKNSIQHSHAAQTMDSHPPSLCLSLSQTSSQDRFLQVLVSVSSLAPLPPYHYICTSEVGRPVASAFSYNKEADAPSTSCNSALRALTGFSNACVEYPHGVGSYRKTNETSLLSSSPSSDSISSSSIFQDMVQEFSSTLNVDAGISGRKRNHRRAISDTSSTFRHTYGDHSIPRLTWYTEASNACEGQIVKEMSLKDYGTVDTTEERPMQSVGGKEAEGDDLVALYIDMEKIGIIGESSEHGEQVENRKEHSSGDLADSCQLLQIEKVDSGNIAPEKETRTSSPLSMNVSVKGRRINTGEMVKIGRKIDEGQRGYEKEKLSHGEQLIVNEGRENRKSSNSSHSRNLSVDRIMCNIHLSDIDRYENSKHCRGSSLNGSMRFNADINGNDEFDGSEWKKIMENDRLKEIALVDPKRVKRILANRESAARSKDRKVRYITELEPKAERLQSKSTALYAQLDMLQKDSNGLSTQNSELKLRLQAMEQQAKLREALHDVLRDEIRRLKFVAQQFSLVHRTVVGQRVPCFKNQTEFLALPQDDHPISDFNILGSDGDNAGHSREPSSVNYLANYLSKDCTNLAFEASMR